MNDTNLWERLGKDDDKISTLEKGQRIVNSQGINLLADRGELRPDKCSYRVHRMKLTDNGEWEYVQEKMMKAAKNNANNDKDELDNL